MKEFKIKQDSSEIIYNLFRAFYPWPGIWTLININGREMRLKITDVKMKEFDGNKKLVINRAQLEGKKEVEFAIFQKAYPNII